eukprot:1664938-Prymnesium_polylepis.1
MLQHESTLVDTARIDSYRLLEMGAFGACCYGPGRYICIRLDTRPPSPAADPAAYDAAFPPLSPAAVARPSRAYVSMPAPLHAPAPMPMSADATSPA